MIQRVDWSWANSLPALAIFEAVGLSLNFELNELAPVGQERTTAPSSTAPPTYGERVFLLYEHARHGRIPLTGCTAERGATFNRSAALESGQFWEVDTAVFRGYCDTLGWAVPVGFKPQGYKPVETTEQRGARLLLAFEREQQINKTGATERVAMHEGGDRSYIGRLIKQAREKRDDDRRNGALNLTQLVISGKKVSR